MVTKKTAQKGEKLALAQQSEDDLKAPRGPAKSVTVQLDDDVLAALETVKKEVSAVARGARLTMTDLARMAILRVNPSD